MNTYKVTVNGITKEYPKGTIYGEIVKDFQDTKRYPVVLVTANGRLRELHKTLKMDQELTLITTQDEIGHKTYKRSVSFLFLKAI